MKRRALPCSLALIIFGLGAAEAKTYAINAGPNADAEAQAAFAAAKSGDQIRFGEGRFELTRPLTIIADEIEVRGKSADKSIISFTHMTGEGDGLSMHGARIELKNLGVADAKGAGIVVSGGNIGVERVAVRGALGPGLLLNGVDGAIVQQSVAQGALNGFEIRNSRRIELIDNDSAGNGVGVLADDQPGAPAGGQIRIIGNRINNNSGQGVGVDLVGVSDVAVLQNEIGEHGTANVFIRSFGADSADPAFDALSRNITVRANKFGRAGFSPAHDWAPAGGKFADIVWDGARSYVTAGSPRTEPVLLAIEENAAASGQPSFLSLGLEAAGAPAGEANPSSAWPPVARFAPPEPVKLK